MHIVFIPADATLPFESFKSYDSAAARGNIASYELAWSLQAFCRCDVSEGIFVLEPTALYPVPADYAGLGYKHDMVCYADQKQLPRSVTRRQE